MHNLIILGRVYLFFWAEQQFTHVEMAQARANVKDHTQIYTYQLGCSEYGTRGLSFILPWRAEKHVLIEYCITPFLEH